MNIEKIKALAHKKSFELSYKAKKTPLETLKTIQFDFQPNSILIDQRKTAIQNIQLDQSSCLGKAAQAAAIVERYHSNCTVQIAEVLQDYLQSIMMQKLIDNPENAYDASFMQELLLYEEPHSILTVNGIQFDPLSAIFGSDIVHPKIQIFHTWQSIAASVTIAESHLVDDPTKKLKILHKAENICPESIVVMENKVGAYILLGDIDQALRYFALLLEKRPCARTIYCMYLLTNEKKYYDLLINTYTKKIIKHIKGEI